MAKAKSPFLAAALSLFVAGLGQMYLRSYRRAAFFLAVELATAALLMYDVILAYALNGVVSLYASYDAYALASKMNEAKKPKEDEIVVKFIK